MVPLYLYSGHIQSIHPFTTIINSQMGKEDSKMDPCGQP